MEKVFRTAGMVAAVVVLHLGAGCSEPPSQTPTGTGGTAGKGGSGGSGGTGGVGGTGGEGGAGGTGGEAIGCGSDVDCGGETPHCDPEGACVACLQDAQCGLGAPACVDGSCAPCVNDEACSGRGRCEVAAGACVQCLGDPDCAGGVCSEDHRCVECRGDSECPGGVCYEGACMPGAPCDDQRPCDPGSLCILQQAGAGVGSCLDVCDVEAQSGCRSGTICQLLQFEEDNTPVGICVAPNGGPQAGETCGVEPSCEANLLCVNFAGSPDGTCSPYCDPDAPSACGASSTCVGVTFTGLPNQPSIHVCAPAAEACATNADCEADEACTLVAGAGGKARLGCIPREGPGMGGAPCAVNAACASGFCITELGLCYGACATGADCVPDSSCVPVGFSSDLVAPTCLKNCASEDDCAPTQTCGLLDRFDGVEGAGVCWIGTGTVGAGNSCTSHAQCKSGTCAGLTRDFPGFCTALCETDDNCAPLAVCAELQISQLDGPDGIPNTADDFYQEVTMCRGASCASDADCGGNWVCVPQHNGGPDTGESLEMRCTPPFGPLEGGTPCTDPGDCTTNFCVAPAGTAICFASCAVDADCPDGQQCRADGVWFSIGEDLTSVSACG